MNDFKSLEKGLKEEENCKDGTDNFPIEFFIERGEKLIKSIRG